MKKFMSLLLSVLLVLSLVPMTISATEKDWNSFVYYQDGAVFSFKATEFKGDSTGYKFYAAAYDADDRLVAVKSKPVEKLDDTLTSDVNLEEGSTAAKLNVAKVKTMLWEGMTPLTRAGEFHIEDSYLIDGYYEPIAASSYPTEGTKALSRHNWYNATSGAAAATPKADKDYWTSWSHSFYLADGDVTTAGDAPTGPNNDYYTQLYFALTAATALDRVAVVYSNDTDMQFYLSKTAPATSENGDYLDEFKGASTDDDNLYYLGDKESAKTVDGKRWLLADVDGEAYQYMIGDIEPNGDLGPIYEFQGFSKVTDEDIVDEFTITKSYNGLAYSQDGPFFTVTAQEFSTNATELYVMATAYDAADAKGTVLAQERQKLDIAETLTGTVDIEKTNMVDASMASVKVEVVDSLGNNVLPAWTKNITNVEGSLVSGMYESITKQGVTYSSSSRRAWYTVAYAAGRGETKADKEYWSSFSENTLVQQTDNNLETHYTNTGGTSNIYQQIVNTLSAPAKIDRVLVVTSTDITGQFYLSSVAPVYSDNATYLDKFKGDATTDTNLFYLGDKNSSKCMDKNGQKWLFAPVNGGNYQYMIADFEPNGDFGPVYEFQGYTKVQDAATIEAFRVDAEWENLTFSQNGPAFSVASEGLTTNASELYFVAEAYDANGKIDAETRKVSAFSGAGELSASVNFEDGGTDDEAPVGITSVKTMIQTADGTVIATADFAVNAPTAVNGEDTYALTNGFYEAISGYNQNGYARYNNNTSNGDANFDITKNGQLFVRKGDGYDNNLATTFGGGNNPYTLGFGVALPLEKFDRVVLWVGDGYYVDGVQVYASTYDPVNANGATTNAELEAFYNLFTTEKNDANIQYLGTVVGRSMALNDAGARLVWDVEGDYTYNYILCRFNRGTENCGGEFRELQGFKKVVAEKPGVAPSAQ